VARSQSLSLDFLYLGAPAWNYYSLPVKQSCFAPFVSAAFIATALAAEQNWTGEYADKKFLNGKAVFEMSVEQSGNTIQVSFDAVYNDGHGCAPEASGPAKVLDKNTLSFTFQDSSHNFGTGRSNERVRI
jgi:hypothetical protein